MSWEKTSSERRPKIAQACLLWDGAMILEHYHYLFQIDDPFFGIWPEIWCRESGPDIPFKAVSHWRPARS